MKTVLRTRLFLVLINFVIFPSLQAKTKATMPYQFDLSTFVRTYVRLFNGNTAKAENFIRKIKEKNTSRICVCEIMDLQNNNSQFSGVALLSEKTNNGDLGKEYKTASKIIDGEKKHMKDFFYDKIKVTNKISAPMDCLSLYMKLSQSAEGIKIYDILDADILSAVH